MSYFDIDRINDFLFGGHRPISGLRGVCVHTTEGSNFPNPPSAQAVTNYQASSRTGSYHVVVDTSGLRVRQNTDDWITWSTGNKGNNILLHISFCAFSGWSRQRWLSERKLLQAGATVVAHWLKKYNWPAQKVAASRLPGVLGHGDTRVWGGTDHTDPGPNFPWAEFLQMVRDEMTDSRPVENMIDTAAEAAKGWIGKRLHDGEKPCKDGVGKYAGFQNGTIYWNPRTGAYAIPTLLMETYKRYQWEQGALGYPIGGHIVLTAPDGERWGDVQGFEGGALYRRYGTPGYAVWGAIRQHWNESGFENGVYGWPISDEKDFDGGKYQDFEKGRIIWSPSNVVGILNWGSDPKLEGA